MTASRLTDALAGLLSSRPLLDEFYRDPSTVRDRYGLTGADLAALRSVPPERMRLSHEMVRNKRIGTLRQLLPQTCAVLAGFDGFRLLMSYVDDALGRADVDVTSGVAQTRDLLRWLSHRPRGALPDGLPDLARFEFTMLDLSADDAAARAAQHRATAPPAPAPAPIAGNAFLSLPPDVRVELFTLDVLGLPAEVTLPILLAAPRRPGGLLLRKVWNARQPACLRLGAAVARLALACDGRHRAADLLAGQPAAASRALQDLADLGVVTVHSRPTGTESR